MDCRLLLTLLIFTSFVIYSTDGRRGGGSRGVGVRVRSGGSSTFRVRNNYVGPRYSSGSWKTAAAVGTLYGLTSYKRRRLYIDNPDKEPTICFNEDELKNETFGYFICPEESQDDSLTSCCGDDNAQYCCEGLSGAVIAGIVGGIVGGIVLIGIIVAIVCVLKQRGIRSKGTAMPAPAVQYTVPNPAATTEPTGFSNVYSTPYSSFPEQTDGQKAPIGFEGSMSVPSSDPPPPYSEHGKF